MSYESIEDYDQWQHILRYGDDGDACGLALAWHYICQRVRGWCRKART